MLKYLKKFICKIGRHSAPNFDILGSEKYWPLGKCKWCGVEGNIYNNEMF